MTEPGSLPTAFVVVMILMDGFPAARAGHDSGISRSVELARPEAVTRDDLRVFRIRPGLRTAAVLDPNVVRIRELMPPRHAKPYLDLPAETVRKMAQLVPKLDWGNVTFLPPASMRAKMEQAVPVRYRRNASPDALRQHLAEEIGVQAADVAIPNEMLARLEGSGFEIKPITPERQPVSSGAEREWKWSVRAVEPGPRNLHLMMSAVVSVGGNVFYCDVKTFERGIQVWMPLSERIIAWLAGNVSWVVPAVVVPLLGGAWALWRARKKARASANPQ